MAVHFLYNAPVCLKAGGFRIGFSHSESTWMGSNLFIPPNTT